MPYDKAELPDHAGVDIQMLSFNGKQVVRTYLVDLDRDNLYNF